MNIRIYAIVSSLAEMTSITRVQIDGKRFPGCDVSGCGILKPDL